MSHFLQIENKSERRKFRIFHVNQNVWRRAEWWLTSSCSDIPSRSFRHISAKIFWWTSRVKLTNSRIRIRERTFSKATGDSQKNLAPTTSLSDEFNLVISEWAFLISRLFWFRLFHEIEWIHDNQNDSIHCEWIHVIENDWEISFFLGNIWNAYGLHTPNRRIRLQIAKKTIDMANLSKALAKFSRNYGIWILAKFLNLFFPRKMVVTKERCLPIREAHPKIHDISARYTGSQERYLWQQAERKHDYEHGQTTRQEREKTSDRPVVAVNQVARQSVWELDNRPSVITAGRLTFTITRRRHAFGELIYLCPNCWIDITEM